MKNTQALAEDKYKGTQQIIHAKQFENIILAIREDTKLMESETESSRVKMMMI